MVLPPLVEGELDAMKVGGVPLAPGFFLTKANGTIWAVVGEAIPNRSDAFRRALLRSERNIRHPQSGSIMNGRIDDSAYGLTASIARRQFNVGCGT